MLEKNGFDNWAGSYDESIMADSCTFPFEGYYDLLAAVVSLVEPKEGMTILDVGVGTGLLSEELRKKGCIIHGVDFSDKMLEKARTRIPDGKFDIVDISKDQFGRFNSCQFDKVISSYFYHHLNNKQKLSFIKRTLENNLLPDGKIIIADIGFENESDFQSNHEKYKDSWDDDEFYLCGETIISHFQTEGIKADYQQFSSCAGILVCTM